MSFQIFIPGATGANPENLTKAGLGDLIPGHDSRPSMSEIMRGPNGAAGQLWGWNELTGVLDFNPDRHTATPCVADPVRKLPAGRFWWIFEKSKPPVEESLRRKEMFQGFSVTLNDGKEWIVPNVLELPEAFGFDDDGTVVKVPKQVWRPFVQDCEWALNQCLDSMKSDDSRDWRRELDVAARVLSANYRINKELILKLELIDPQNVLGVLMRAVDRNRLSKLIETLKNEEAGAATLVGSEA